MNRRRQIELAEPAWHYPSKGGHYASCGHYEPFPYDSTEGVNWWDWNEWGQLVPFCATYCAPCAVKLKVSGAYIPEHKLQEAWGDE
jgi:hypothetical protein